MIWFGGGSESRAWWCICPAALWRSSQTAKARQFATIFTKNSILCNINNCSSVKHQILKYTLCIVYSILRNSPLHRTNLAAKFANATEKYYNNVTSKFSQRLEYAKSGSIMNFFYEHFNMLNCFQKTYKNCFKWPSIRLPE